VLHIGEDSEVLQGSWLMIADDESMRIGNRVFISQHAAIAGTVSIGDDTLIGGYVSIIANRHEFHDKESTIASQGGRSNPVKIGSDVWIGTNVVILDGVAIGDHAIIGANSTVTHNVPAYSIVAGNPAVCIGQR
jgi:acetyltransferase-like isoleucine patch superfamily enzyme